MTKRFSVVSIILFSISVLLFVIFAITIFFGGQKIGGSIYFIYFVIMLAFAFLDRKYASNFTYLYRFSAYISDAFNILAVSSILFYERNTALMIACCALVSLSLLIDLFSKNRVQKRMVGSIMMGVFNCCFMFCVFPYFFDELTSPMAIAAVVFASLIVVTKLVLAFIKPEKTENEKDNGTELEKSLAVEADTDVE